ncbi:MAG: LytR family transcriptional regulator [Ruminococcaceae bacterium]|nr:LytR family transcriptional regulator [Oscillospiraceae bacterium]
MNNNYKSNHGESYKADAVTDSRPDIYDDSYYNDSDTTDMEDPRILEYRERYTDVTEHRVDERIPARIKKKKRKRMKKVISFFAIVLLSLLLITVVVGWIFSLTIPSKTVFLIMATDLDGTRTDTLMLGSFDKHSKDITLASIPRDTYVTVSDEMYEKMNEDYPEPGSKSMKINSVHHYGGEKYGVDLLVEQVENLIGTDIDYYVKVDFEAFRYIIDSVGGVDFYVPRDMEYHDPLQNLHISLKEGQQRLDGAQAEQVLRYRSGYANADLGRVDVQQQFMKAFIGQVLSSGSIFSKAQLFFDILFKYGYVDTDAGVFDAVSYAFVLGGIDISELETYTLPGESAYAGGQSVYKLDEEETNKIIESMVK